jgi:formylmethanofuran dehydrogenase subunit E
VCVMDQLQPYLAQLAALHENLCVPQILGLRIGLHALKLLNGSLPQKDHLKDHKEKRLFTFVESDGCFADGVSVATGCWLGQSTLRLIDYGKPAATFVDTRTGRAIRVSLSEKAREYLLNHQTDTPEHLNKQLHHFQAQSSRELLTEAKVMLTMPLKSLTAKTDSYTVCDECHETIISERTLRISGKTLCRSCAAEGYYVPDARR